LGPEVLDQRAARVRHARQARLVAPVVVLVAVALLSTMVVVRNRSVVDVATTPATTDPAPLDTTSPDTQAEIALLRSTLELRTALSHELLDLAVTIGDPASPAGQARRAATDAALDRYRSSVRTAEHITDPVMVAIRTTESRLNTLAVTRRSVDQDQAATADTVEQYRTTLRTLVDVERSLADQTTDLNLYKALTTITQAAAIADSGSAVLALDALAVSDGRFADEPGSAAPGCGADPATAGGGCRLYQALVQATYEHNYAYDALMDPSVASTSAEVKTVYRATAVVPRAQDLVKRVLDGGDGKNDLSDIALDEMLTVGHQQIEAWANFQRSLLDLL
jgi:hypothetical protein